MLLLNKKTITTSLSTILLIVIFVVHMAFNPINQQLKISGINAHNNYHALHFSHQHFSKEADSSSHYELDSIENSHNNLTHISSYLFIIELFNFDLEATTHPQILLVQSDYLNPYLFKDNPPPIT